MNSPTSTASTDGTNSCHSAMPTASPTRTEPPVTSVIDSRDSTPALGDRADQLGGDRVELARPELIEATALGDERVGDGASGHRADLDHVAVQPTIDEGHQRADREQCRPMPAAGQGDGELTGPARLHVRMLPPGGVGPSMILARTDARGLPPRVPAGRR